MGDLFSLRTERVGLCEIVLGDSRLILDDLHRRTTATVTDPPYGISLKTNNAERGRGYSKEKNHPSNDFPLIVGDEQEFDPRPLLWRDPLSSEKERTVVLFGANWFARHLPPSGGWIVWDKLDGLTSKREMGFNDNSDCELLWTNSGNCVRILRHRWMGLLTGSEIGKKRVHPTQKPVELMARIIEHWTTKDDIILDPYAESGSTLVACQRLGRRCVGVEIERAYWDICCRRVAEEIGRSKEI